MEYSKRILQSFLIFSLLFLDSLMIHEVALSSQSYANIKHAIGTNKRICNRAPRAKCAYIINGGTAPRA